MRITNAVLLNLSLSCFVFLTGCVKKEVKPAPDNSNHNQDVIPIPPSVVLSPSFDSLAEPLSDSNQIPWQVALTLGEIARFTYDEPASQISSIQGLGAETVRPIVVGLAHGVVASNDKAVVIAFRGTKDPADWLTDARIIGYRHGDGKIHLGFYEVVDSVFRKAFQEALDQGAKNKTVWITGHSLGGAMAIVFAYRGLTEHKLEPAGIITFGQPLAFSHSLAQVLLDKFNTRYIRFVNNWDAVPRLLPNYRHAGSRIYMKSDDFQFRMPVMAFSAPASADSAFTTPSPSYSFDENEPELEPMSPDEFKAFQEQLRQEQEPHPVGGYGAAPVGAFSIPWFEAHSMLLYTERIKKFGEKDLNGH